MSALYFTLENGSLQVTLTNYGARIVGVVVPDKNGKSVDVVTGFATVNDYLNATAPYYGAVIGRFANRIGKAAFTLNDKTYQLPVNNGPNTLHGGNGLHTKLWEARQVDERIIEFTTFSPAGEEGFPGDLNVKVTYSLTHDKGIRIDYEAFTSEPTVVNLTNHAYFNLNGEGAGDVLNHTVEINADAITPVDANLIPTGIIEPIEGTPFDFRKPHTVGERIDDQSQQLAYGHGYDHNYILNKADARQLSFAARATGDLSGITMTVHTTEAGMQFYSGNFMNGSNIFKGGAADDCRTAFAMETQHFPDSPNQPAFPSTVLNPGDMFKSTTIYTFA